MNLVTREILLSFWKVHILHHANEQSIHGHWVVAELRRHGYEISPGTLYPLLHRMVRHGWLRCRKVSGGGLRARKDYRLTAEGREELARVRAQIAELYREVVIGSVKPPAQSRRRGPPQPASSPKAGILKRS